MVRQWKTFGVHSRCGFNMIQPTYSHGDVNTNVLCDVFNDNEYGFLESVISLSNLLLVDVNRTKPNQHLGFCQRKYISYREEIDLHDLITHSDSYQSNTHCNNIPIVHRRTGPY